MALNKLALIRYKTIDECLANRGRRWTLNDLMEKVSAALGEYEGIYEGVSRRTVQLDIQHMRSDKLGYHAPIVVTERKYYTYADRDYRITKTTLSRPELDKLQDAVRVLGQFRGFASFEDLGAIMGRLEGKIGQHATGQTLVEMEKNELLKGLEWIEPLLQALKNRRVITLHYQSFKARAAVVATVHPYLLKEYRNRWFLLGGAYHQQPTPSVSIYALDRIHSVVVHPDEASEPAYFDVAHFFDDALGVSKAVGQQPIEVVLRVAKRTVPYVLTKPLHASQTLLSEDDTGAELRLTVVWNFELEREILGFGESLTALAPPTLRQNLRLRLERTLKSYH